jgi:hypothetical protein
MANENAGILGDAYFSLVHSAAARITFIAWLGVQKPKCGNKTRGTARSDAKRRSISHFVTWRKHVLGSKTRAGYTDRILRNKITITVHYENNASVMYGCFIAERSGDNSVTT